MRGWATAADLGPAAVGAARGDGWGEANGSISQSLHHSLSSSVQNKRQLGIQREYARLFLSYHKSCTELDRTISFFFSQLNPALDFVVKSHPKKDLHFKGYLAFPDCHQISALGTTKCHKFVVILM